MRRTVALLIAVLMVEAGLWAASGAGEEPTPQPIGGLGFIDEVEVTVVNVDVFVRDGKGRAVENLGKDDFRILQDGKEMPISNFAFLIHERPEPVGDVAMAPEAEGRPPASASAVAEPVYVVLHVDNENLRPLDRNRKVKVRRARMKSS